MTKLIAVKATRDFGVHVSGDELLLDSEDREVQGNLKSGLLVATEPVQEPKDAPKPAPKPKQKPVTKPKPKPRKSK